MGSSLRPSLSLLQQPEARAKPGCLQQVGSPKFQGGGTQGPEGRQGSPLPSQALSCTLQPERWE